MSNDPQVSAATTTSQARDSDRSAARIVVGVDDSEQAAAALRWALAEGVLRQATVEVVHAWSPPVSALPFGATLVIPVDEAAIDSAARASVEELSGVEGVGAHWAETIKDAMSRIAESSILDRYA